MTTAEYAIERTPTVCTASSRGARRPPTATSALNEASRRADGVPLGVVELESIGVTSLYACWSAPGHLSTATNIGSSKPDERRFLGRMSGRADRGVVRLEARQHASLGRTRRLRDARARRLKTRATQNGRAHRLGTHDQHHARVSWRAQGTFVSLRFSRKNTRGADSAAHLCARGLDAIAQKRLLFEWDAHMDAIDNYKAMCRVPRWHSDEQ